MPRDFKGFDPLPRCQVSFNGEHSWLKVGVDGARVCHLCAYQVNRPAEDPLQKIVPPVFSEAASKKLFWIFRFLWNVLGLTLAVLAVRWLISR